MNNYGANYNTYAAADDSRQYHHHYWVNNNVGSSDNMAAATAASGNVNNRNGGGGGGKPIRRRSRVSKKTPITLLNTDATNFRSLVQQFTGCHHGRNGAVETAPLDGTRGPLNLNFQLGTVQTGQLHGSVSYDRNSGSEQSSTTTMANYGGDGDEVVRMGGQNHMEMVQELLMVDDDGQDEFGLFR
ncbi:hypothetical protein LINPERHAP1_LOCUS32254 [Linum perenne]